MGPVFTPPVVKKADGPLGTLAMATNSGGTNWAGGSYDPETHILYAPSQRIMRTLGLIPGDQKGSEMTYVYDSAATGSGAEGAGPGLTIEGLPLAKPPYGSITAINLDTGEIQWQIAHGETPDYIRNHEALKGINIPRTGRPGVFGVLITKTLVIAGERAVTGQPDAMLRAYDKATGREVGAVPMPAGQTGTPMTYMLNGKQYIAVAVSGIGAPAELVAFRLPDSDAK
jgi:glucose dehydrogenase